MEFNEQILELCKAYLKEKEYARSQEKIDRRNTINYHNVKIEDEIMELINGDRILFSLYMNAAFSLQYENYEYMNEIRDYIIRRTNKRLTLVDIKLSNDHLYESILIDIHDSIPIDELHRIKVG